MNDGNCERVSLGSERDAKCIRLVDSDVPDGFIDIACAGLIESGQRQDKTLRCFPPSESGKRSPLEFGIAPENEREQPVEFRRGHAHDDRDGRFRDYVSLSSHAIK
jgi:hypothetical protein